MIYHVRTEMRHSLVSFENGSSCGNVGVFIMTNNHQANLCMEAIM